MKINSEGMRANRQQSSTVYFTHWSQLVTNSTAAHSEADYDEAQRQHEHEQHRQICLDTFRQNTHDAVDWTKGRHEALRNYWQSVLPHLGGHTKRSKVRLM